MHVLLRSSHLLWRGFGPWGTILLETVNLLAASTSFEGDTAGGNSCSSWRLINSLLPSSPLDVLKPRTIELGKRDSSRSRRKQESKCRRKNMLTAYVRERERQGLGGKGMTNSEGINGFSRGSLFPWWANTGNTRNRAQKSPSILWYGVVPLYSA